MNVKKVLIELSACREAVEWVAGRDIQTAWNECERGDWLLWIAARLEIDRKLVVLAACDCAEQSLKHIPDGEDRPRLAIETARQWATGAASIEHVRQADASAYASAYAADASAYASADAASASAYAATAAYAAAATAAADAASAAAYAYASAAADAAAAASAADAAAYAATAAVYVSARAESLKKAAKLVRKHITAEMIETAVNERNSKCLS